MRILLALLLLWPMQAWASVIVAVSYFENASGDAGLDALRKGFAEMLITDLAVSDEVRVVERGRLEEILGEIALQQSPFVDPETAVRLGKGLGAALIVTGSYVVQGETLRVDARVLDVEDGEVLVAVKAEGELATFLDVQRSIAEQLLGELGAELSILDKKRIGAAGTSSYAAFLEYATGLDSLDAGELALAEARFQAALESDPEFAAAQAQRERVERLSSVLDESQRETHLAVVAEHWRGRDCACLYVPPAGEAFEDIAERVPYRLLKVGDTVYASGPSYWPNQLQLPVALAALGLDAEADAALAAILSDEMAAAPMSMRNGSPDGSWYSLDHNPTAPEIAAVARCNALQVASYLDLLRLDLDAAMAHQVESGALPKGQYSAMCMGGIAFTAIGIPLEEPLRTRIERVLDDPALFRELKAMHETRLSGADAARVELERRTAAVCEELCPWQ